MILCPTQIKTSWFHYFSLNIWMLMMLLCFHLFWKEYSVILEFKLLGGYFPETNCVFVIDGSSILFLLMVSMVSFFVFKFSYWYMDEEVNWMWFYCCFWLFLFSMFLLSMSSSFFWVLLGWDGLGVTSFLLIIFYSNWKSFNSAMLTFLSNRVGDFFLISVIWASLSNFGSTNLIIGENFLVSVLIVLTSFSKSAQIPFSAWLPMAMAAPTPVSALVHSSTLVTAGVYLVIRFFPLLNETTLHFMVLISFVTILVAGTNASVSFDLKKIIAFSTMSHLGLMFFMVGWGVLTATFCHLLIHASFKSLLFMLGGVLIHSNMGVQDIRVLKCPSMFLGSVLVVAVLSNMGAVFLSGFYSKELMFLDLMESNLNPEWVWGGFLVSVSLTCIYSIRLVYYLFMNPVLPLNSFTIDLSVTKNLIWYSSFSTGFSSMIVWWIGFGLTGEVSFWESSTKLMSISSTTVFLLVFLTWKVQNSKLEWVFSSMWGLYWLIGKSVKGYSDLSMEFLWTWDVKGSGMISYWSLSLFKPIQTFIGNPKTFFTLTVGLIWMGVVSSLMP